VSLVAHTVILPTVKDDETLFRRRTIAALDALIEDAMSRPYLVAVGTATLDGSGTSTTISAPGATDDHFAVVAPNDADALALAPFVSLVAADEIEVTHATGTDGDVTWLVIAPAENA
jgi:hypothetical protein